MVKGSKKDGHFRGRTGKPLKIAKHLEEAATRERAEEEGTQSREDVRKCGRGTRNERHRGSLDSLSQPDDRVRRGEDALVIEEKSRRLQKKGSVVCAICEEVWVGVAKENVVDVLKYRGQQVQEGTEEMTNAGVGEKW